MPLRKKKKFKKTNKQRQRRNHQIKNEKPRKRNKTNKNVNTDNTAAGKATSKSIQPLLKHAYNELNTDSIAQIMHTNPSTTISQQTLSECFDIIWKKCGDRRQCTEHLLSNKLSLMETLLTHFKLNLNQSHNFCSAKPSDTLFDRVSLLCNKCLLPMIELSIECMDLSGSYQYLLKQLLLQQLHFSLFEYIDHLGLKFEHNSVGIIDMSWYNIIQPTLDKWWSSSHNLQCRAIVPWCISHGVYLDAVLPYFSMFKEYIFKQGEGIPNIDGVDDKSVFNPSKLSMNDDAMIDELHISELVYKLLLVTVGKSLLRRKRNVEDVNMTSLDRFYDTDLEYLYMSVADLFDEGRLRWLRTDKGVAMYQSYVESVNECIDSECPLIGKIVTYFLIGNAGMIIV